MGDFRGLIIAHVLQRFGEDWDQQWKGRWWLDTKGKI